MNSTAQNNKILLNFFQRYFFDHWSEKKSISKETRKYCDLLFSSWEKSEKSKDLYKKQLKKLQILLDYFEEVDIQPPLSLNFMGVSNESFLEEVLQEISEYEPKVFQIKLGVDQLRTDTLSAFLEKNRGVEIKLLLQEKNLQEANRFPKNDFDELEFWYKIRPSGDFKKKFLSLEKEISNNGYSWWKFFLEEEGSAEWMEKQVKEYKNFLRFLVKWTFDKEANFNFLDFIFQKRGLGVLSRPFLDNRDSFHNLKNSLSIRISDLSLIPSRRLNKEELVFGKFNPLRERERLKALNLELALMLYTFKREDQPMCESCLLHPLCSFGPLKEQLETTGEMFSPIPIICKLEHNKVKSILKGLKDINMYKKVMDKLSPVRRQAVEKLIQLG